MIRGIAVGWIAGAVALGACERRQGARSDVVPDGSAAEASFSAGVSGPSGGSGTEGGLSARCRATDAGISLVGPAFASAPRDMDLGDALWWPGGYAVAVLYSGVAGRTAAVAVLDADGGAAPHVIDLGPTFGDAPPPRLARCGDRLVAAAFEPPRWGTQEGGRDKDRSPARSLRFWDVTPHFAKALGTLDQQRDDSLAFDIACSATTADGGQAAPVLAVVWDESARAFAPSPASVAADAAMGARLPRGLAAKAPEVAYQEYPAQLGVIRIAFAGLGQPFSVALGASAVGSDADEPRVVAAGQGFLVVWLAHGPETPRTPVAPTDIEAPGEARSYGWLEMAIFDRTGSPTGPIRRLTSTSGHVSAFDVVTKGVALDDRSKPIALLVARDDGEGADGAGGTLLRLRAAEELVELPVAVPTDELGRGPPTFVGEGDGVNDGAWIAWVGARERLRLLPLDLAGAPTAASSPEDAIDDARPLLLLDRTRVRKPGGQSARENADTQMLVATPKDPASPLRVFQCRQ